MIQFILHVFCCRCYCLKICCIAFCNNWYETKILHLRYDDELDEELSINYTKELSSIHAKSQSNFDNEESRIRTMSEISTTSQRSNTKTKIKALDMSSFFAMEHLFIE